MTDWDTKGCSVCRNEWLTGKFPPEVSVNQTRHTVLHKCTVCGTLWEQSERYADTISLEDARRYYPEAALQEKPSEK